MQTAFSRRPARRAACSPAARGGAGLGGCRPPSIALITMCCCISFILPVSLVHPLPLFLPRRPFYNFRANHETRAGRDLTPHGRRASGRFERWHEKCLLKDLTVPFYSANRPDATVSQGLRDAF